MLLSLLLLLLFLLLLLLLGSLITAKPVYWSGTGSFSKTWGFQIRLFYLCIIPWSLAPFSEYALILAELTSEWSQKRVTLQPWPGKMCQKRCEAVRYCTQCSNYNWDGCCLYTPQFWNLSSQVLVLFNFLIFFHLGSKITRDSNINDNSLFLHFPDQDNVWPSNLYKLVNLNIEDPQYFHICSVFLPWLRVRQFMRLRDTSMYCTHHSVMSSFVVYLG